MIKHVSLASNHIGSISQPTSKIHNNEWKKSNAFV